MQTGSVGPPSFPFNGTGVVSRGGNGLGVKLTSHHQEPRLRMNGALPQLHYMLPMCSHGRLSFICATAEEDFISQDGGECRSQWPRFLRRVCGRWVCGFESRPVARMSVSCECCVLSSRGL